jgi:hypothetical protein
MRSDWNLVVTVCAMISFGACDRGDGLSAAGGPASSAPANSLVAPTVAAAQVVIAVDAAHDVMAKKDAPPYPIAPCSALALDFGDHRFAMPDAAGGAGPNAVHVVHGASGYYRGSFSGRRVTLSAASLDPVKGREAFAGFEAGESYIVAVGTEMPSPSDGALRFAPMWTAKVSVAAR